MSESIFYAAAKTNKGKFSFDDCPEFFFHLMEANRFEEKLQHNLADIRALTPGLEACLRGLWRGRDRKHREDIPSSSTPTASVTDEA